MVGAGIVVLWLGYSAFCWGVAFLEGETASFLDLVWPGHWTTKKKG